MTTADVSPIERAISLRDDIRRPQGRLTQLRDRALSFTLWTSMLGIAIAFPYLFGLLFFGVEFDAVVIELILIIGLTVISGGICFIVAGLGAINSLSKRIRDLADVIASLECRLNGVSMDDLARSLDVSTSPSEKLRGIEYHRLLTAIRSRDFPNSDEGKILVMRMLEFVDLAEDGPAQQEGAIQSP